MQNTKLFVVTHKKIFYKLKKDYIPIQVGKNKKKFEDNYILDNTGDNISAKNDNYCELTAIYWLWKNYKLPNYIGLCHYRRFFVKKPFCTLITSDYIERILEKYDIILPYPYRTGETVKEHFINSPSGRREDIERLEKIINENYTEYYEDFKYVMDEIKISYWNMFITNKTIFNEYCEWLFGILFEYEKTTDLTGYTKEEARIYGFLSEFLLNVWVRNKKLNVKYIDVLMVKENKMYNFAKKNQLLIKGIKRNLDKILKK